VFVSKETERRTADFLDQMKKKKNEVEKIWFVLQMNLIEILMILFFVSNDFILESNDF
jgi:hypothetical protein